MSGQPQRILVVAPAWVGDMIMSQVIYASLRNSYQDLKIDVLAPRATLALVQRMDQVNRGILIDLDHGDFGFAYRKNLGRQLARERYDQAIVTPNSFKSALVPMFAGIQRRTGFLGEYRYFLLNDIKLLDEKRLPLMTDRFLALAGKVSSDLIRPKLLVDKGNQSRFLDLHRLELDKPIVGFCPGAEFGDAKKWPEQHYIEVARQLVSTGHDVWVFGSPADAGTGRAISDAVGDGCTNLAGKTSLLDAIDLLALCSRVVTNDSGLMHVAAAVGVKVVAIYGSTSPGFTPPLIDDAKIVRLDLDCSPCFQRECPLGHKDCLNKLGPDKVLAQL